MKIRTVFLNLKILCAEFQFCEIRITIYGPIQQFLNIYIYQTMKQLSAKIYISERFVLKSICWTYEVGLLNSLTDVINLSIRKQLYLELYELQYTPLGDSCITSPEFSALNSKAWMKVLFCQLLPGHSPACDFINSAQWKLAAFSFILPFEINRSHICPHSTSSMECLHKEYWVDRIF